MDLRIADSGSLDMAAPVLRELQAKEEAMPIAVEGTVAPEYEAVRDAFAANFAIEGDYRELGASLAAFHRGRCVVDLWGGFRDGARTRAWTRDTLVNVWSSTKAVTAAAVGLCVERGLVRYDDKIVSVWPEFAAAGKERVTLAHVMSHQAGLPGFAEPTTIEDQFDWDGCCGKLARQAPAWSPGSETSYHAMTYGWLAGEVVRRVSGRSIGEFVREHIARRLDASIFIGLPESEEPRVAETMAPKNMTDPASLPLPQAARMAITNPGQDPRAPNQRKWRKAEIPAANGHTDARSLALFYASLVNGGKAEAPRLLPRELIKEMTTPAAPKGRKDMFLGFVDSWGLGLALNTPGIYGPNPGAFGHSGWGGSFGCADPEAEIAIGYVPNQMGSELVGDPRTLGLCNAVLGAAARR
jgi:CubicO group peptidase (beta-lactamase class C family)